MATGVRRLLVVALALASAGCGRAINREFPPIVARGPKAAAPDAGTVRADGGAALGDEDLLDDAPAEE